MTPEQIIRAGIKVVRATNTVKSWFAERNEAKENGMTVEELRNYKEYYRREANNRNLKQLLKTLSILFVIGIIIYFVITKLIL